jgi:hypothetical protein
MTPGELEAFAGVDVAAAVATFLQSAVKIFWIPAREPKHPWFRVSPTLELVRSTCLGWCPGIRLSRGLDMLEDSQGYLTIFYWCLPGSLYARVRDPAGCVSWCLGVRQGALVVTE